MTARKSTIAGIPVYLFEELPSTNTYAKEAFLRGELSFGLIRANRQSAGRGRLGRSFFSENGLFISLLLPPDHFSIPPALLTSATAAAVCRTIRACGYDAKIKWVNDILVAEKKVCGILAEAVSLGSEIRAYVIGIGVNTGACRFPPELCKIAGSLEELNADTLLHLLLPNLMSALSESPESILQTCTEHSAVLGRTIHFFGAEEGYGIAIELASDGGLLVRGEDGTWHHLRSGEVSVRLK